MQITAWQSSNLTWIDAHYSFSQLIVSNINSKLLTAPPLTVLDPYHRLQPSWLLAAWMSGTTFRILHLAQKIISCLLLIPALLFYLLFEEEVKTLDPPQQVQGCSNARWVRSGDRTPSSSPVTTNPCCLPSSQPFLTLSLSRFLDCCLFQMVAINSASIFTRTQDFPLLNSCLYWLACPHVRSTWVASIKPHLLPAIESRQNCPKSPFLSWFNMEVWTFSS